MTPKCPDCKRDQDECICKDEIASLRAEVEALHTKLAQFTKWNSQLTAKCNWYNCDGARLEREIEALKQQVEQIEQETAEAIAAYFGQQPHVEHFGDNIAEAVRSGKWREYL